VFVMGAGVGRTGESVLGGSSPSSRISRADDLRPFKPSCNRRVFHFGVNDVTGVCMNVPNALRALTFQSYSMPKGHTAETASFSAMADPSCLIISCQQSCIEIVPTRGTFATPGCMITP
jgi:hypothetical protein